MDTQADAKKELAGELVRLFDRLIAKRGPWEIQWEEVSQVVLPHYSTSFFAQGNTTPGAKRNQRMFDVTAANALNKFAAAMESMLTPRNTKWHRLAATNPDLNKIREVQMWFDQVTDILFHFRESPRANYAAQQHERYISLGAFGTGALFTDALDGGGIRYRFINVGELYFLENHQGVIDTAFRRFKLTVRQAAQKWGVDALPEQMKSKLKDQPETEFMFLHVVKPRADLDPTRKDYKGKKWASYYICKDTITMMSEGGYSSFPYSISRYILAPGETYGRSPAMTVLPGINVLNEEKKTILKQGHRAVDPVLLAHDDGILDGFSLKPGAVNSGAVSPDGRPLVHSLPTGNMQIGKELMDDERLAINDSFLVTLFQILVETPQMTATEVLERAREKGALLSPTMGRQESEALGPQIERELDILAQQGKLPPMPDVLREAQGEYKIVYDSPLARARRAEEAAGAMRTAQWAAEIAAQTQDPSAMDWFDWDQIIPELAYINATPVRWMRDPNAVQQLRQGRQQQQATQQVIDAGPSMAAMMKAANPSGAPTQ